MAPRARLLLTRPRPAAEAFAADLPLGLDVHISPILRITDIPVTTQIDKNATLLFTSRRGVDAAQAQRLGIGQRAFCVGDATAESARRAGYMSETAAGDVDDLFAYCLDRPEAAPFWHLRGNISRGNLVMRLNKRGLKGEEVIVYQQDKEVLDETARLWLTGSSWLILPLFSPLSARYLSEDFDPSPHIDAIAMSDAVADALGDAWQERTRVVSAPEARAMQSEIRKVIAGGRPS